MECVQNVALLKVKYEYATRIQVASVLFLFGWLLGDVAEEGTALDEHSAEFDIETESKQMILPNA
jgi:hypothetical protein